MADDVLYAGVRGVTDLMIMPGLINLDFADIRTVMSEMGKAMMGTGEAEGDKRALDAAEAAINNPLLEDISMKGARGVLINITGGMDMTLFEVDEAANRIRDEVDSEANIIFGSTFDEKLNGKMRVSVVATGIEIPGQQPQQRPVPLPAENKRSVYQPKAVTPPLTAPAAHPNGTQRSRPPPHFHSPAAEAPLRQEPNFGRGRPLPLRNSRVSARSRFPAPNRATSDGSNLGSNRASRRLANSRYRQPPVCHMSKQRTIHV